MSTADPLAIWRQNPFFVLEIGTDASRPEVERAGQRLLALLQIGSAAAEHYATPLGPAQRDADLVRQALAELRDPARRIEHELWAMTAPMPAAHAASTDPCWPGLEPLIGWQVAWPQS